MNEKISTTKKVNTQVLTVMFVDIVGYTKTTSQLTRSQVFDIIELFEDITASVIEKHDGFVVKKIGDAFLATFNSPTNAVLCGIDLQKSFRAFRIENKKQNPRIRVALNQGEAVIRNNDVFGDVVNTAARIESITKPNDIVFSKSVFLSMNENEIPSTHIGNHKLKGLKHPVALFKVKGKPDVLLKKIMNAKKRKKLAKSEAKNRKKEFVKTIVAIILVLFLAAIMYYGLTHIEQYII